MRKTWILPKVQRTPSLMRISVRLPQDYHRAHMAPQHFGGDTQRKPHTNETPPRYQTFRIVNHLTVKTKRFFLLIFVLNQHYVYTAASDNTRAIKRSL